MRSRRIGSPPPLASCSAMAKAWRRLGGSARLLKRRCCFLSASLSSSRSTNSPTCVAIVYLGIAMGSSAQKLVRAMACMTSIAARPVGSLRATSPMFWMTTAKLTDTTNCTNCSRSMSRLGLPSQKRLSWCPRRRLDAIMNWSREPRFTSKWMNSECSRHQ